MGIVVRIFRDVRGHVTSRLLLLRWSVSTQYNGSEASDRTATLVAFVVRSLRCEQCDDRAWRFAVYSLAVSRLVRHFVVRI